MTDTGEHDLVLTRRLNASRKALWRCWTEPDLMKQWFCPKPWKLADCTVDLRTGGEFMTAMQGPEGEAHSDSGVWLEVEPMERLVFTNTMTPGWRPADFGPHGFGMTVTVTFRDAAEGGTVYTAHVMHKNAADKAAHEAMGFEGGWGTAAAQLDTLAQNLPD